MADHERILADLDAEGAELDGLVGALPDEAWARPTPAPGWTVAHQIGHLAWTDDQAYLAAARPEQFGAVLARAAAEPALVDEGAAELAELPPVTLLARWRNGRARLARALADVVARGTRLPWFGVSMSAPSMATARIMETWAHGQDIADTLGAVRSPGPRLRHVAHIGVRARDFAFLANALPPPAEEFGVALTAPDGTTWTWGPAAAAQRVSGSALDFCLLVTQRRHRRDTDVVAEGSDAERWLTIAQAFAGPPGPGRPPR